MAFPTDMMLQLVYGRDASDAAGRYRELARRFESEFGGAEPEFFSAPGRTEIIGNHTDHNGGKILAASITMDTICAAAPTGDDVVRIVSEGYDEPIVVDLDRLEAVPYGPGSTALVAGMLTAVRAFGFEVAGFSAVVSTQVIPAAGVSSSASFEMLVCAVIDHLFNADAMTCADYARIGQYAENVFWGKGSGLMDQMACSVGGTILLDFSRGVSYEEVDFSYDALGYDLVIVNTGKGHADLSEEYSSVPDEMHAVAAALGVSNLCDTSEEALLANLGRVRSEVGSDRAVMRALHYFEECARVEEARRALGAGDKARVLDLIEASGNSSWKWLQNAYVSGDPAEQPVSLALALTEIFLRRAGSGACRLHGGGFAGVIMCAVEKDLTQSYIDYMASYFGSENVYLTGIRQAGAVCLG